MSLPRYPTYKDSGVEWLGALPSPWGIGIIKHTTYLKGRVGWKGLTSEEYVESGHAYLVTGSDFRGKYIEWELCYQVDEARYEDDPFIQLRNNDLLITKDGTIGKVALVQGLTRAACLNSGIFLVRPTRGYITQFMYWVLQSIMFVSFCDLRTTGSTILHLYQNVFAGFRFPLPSDVEQLHIAAFLDRETAKIDALVAEQQRLIELLKEKRQAVISNAVTRGVNPEAAMKPSGIEWLPEVPAHWGAVQVKNLARSGAKTFTDGDWIEAPYVTSEGVRLLQTGNVGIGVFKEQGFRYVSDETFVTLRCTQVHPRDVLICRLDGPVGRACLAPDLGVRMITSVDNAILKVAPHVMPEFVVALFSSVPWISWIDALCRVGGGFRLRVSRSQLGELRVPLPPPAEQAAIIRHLDVVFAHFDTLTAEAQRAIDLLQERRTALISAAVTGQIDVRPAAERASA